MYIIKTTRNTYSKSREN